jgi:hypothetical protein
VHSDLDVGLDNEKIIGFSVELAISERISFVNIPPTPLNPIKISGLISFIVFKIEIPSFSISSLAKNYNLSPPIAIKVSFDLFFVIRPLSSIIQNY